MAGASEVLGRALTAVGVDPSTVDLESLSTRRSVRVSRFEDLVYVGFRRQFRGVPEGTLVAFRRGEHLVVWGYPSIRRMLLPRIAVPRWFPGPTVLVEEKMNGYNVRVFSLGGRIYAATRGGLVCPYTTRRLRRLHGEALQSLLDSLGPGSYIAGEVVGLENPYTRYYYEEAPGFGYFIFDIFKEGTPLPPRAKFALAPEHGLRTVNLLAELPVDGLGVERLYRIVEDLERRGREGVIVKDPEGRVEPLKYTTSSTNIGDIRLGMRYPFEEGRSFLFPRILREIFREWETGRRSYGELGEAILAPAIEAVEAVSRGERLVEEFELVLGGEDETEEVIAYFASLGVHLEIAGVSRGVDGVRVSFRKPRKSEGEIAKILETGISP
ncbi:RNA ligase [Aeropyrum camini]|nr:RNA ligase [Aeropyrum camini]